MSLAALGCNPEDRHGSGSDGADGPGASPGDLRYSGSEIYLCVEADAALRAVQRLFPQGRVSRLARGPTRWRMAACPVCVPQTAIANGHYGWGLVFGQGPGAVGWWSPERARL